MSDTVGDALDTEIGDLKSSMQDLSDSMSEFAVNVTDFMADMEDRVTRMEHPPTSTEQAIEKSHNVGAVCEDFELSLQDLSEVHRVLEKTGNLNRLRLRIWEELLVRKARASLTDRRPMEDLTYLQQEGRRGAIKGARNEVAVVQVLSGHEKLPSWMGDVRACTEEEDERGIDVVVETDIGEIYLQVKSSYSNAQKFLRKWPQRNVGMVVIRPQDDRDTIFNKAMDAVAKQRSDVMKAGGVWEG